MTLFDNRPKEIIDAEMAFLDRYNKLEFDYDKLKATFIKVLDTYLNITEGNAEIRNIFLEEAGLTPEQIKEK